MTFTAVVLGVIANALGLLVVAIGSRAYHLKRELRSTRRQLDHATRVLATYRAANDQAITEFLKTNGEPS